MTIELKAFNNQNPVMQLPLGEDDRLLSYISLSLSLNTKSKVSK